MTFSHVAEKLYTHVPAPEILPEEIRKMGEELTTLSRDKQTDFKFGFRRDPTMDTGLETPGRKYAYLLEKPHMHISDFEFGQHASSAQYESLCDWGYIQQMGPEHASHLYDASLKPKDLNRAKKGRTFLLNVVCAAFKHLNILEEVQRFGQKVTGVPVPAGALAVRALFARYYCVEGGSSIHGWNKIGESVEFPPHVDPGSYTVVLTVPTKKYETDGGMELQIIDPYSVHYGEWSNADGIEGTAAVASYLAGPACNASESVKIQPWSYAIMANPLLHQVTRLTKGERLAFIIFLGYQN